MVDNKFKFKKNKLQKDIEALYILKNPEDIYKNDGHYKDEKDICVYKHKDNLNKKGIILKKLNIDGKIICPMCELEKCKIENDINNLISLLSGSKK